MEELFNLDEDLLEENDVAAQHPEIVAEIEALMKQARTPPTIERFKFEELGDEVIDSANMQ